MSKITIDILHISTLEEIEQVWTPEDYIALLGLFGLEGAEEMPKNELLDLLQMAITEKEPNESAHILLTYALSDELNEGQIDQISNEMAHDRIAEEYPNISLHYTLFNINQLLFKAYNGKFPSTKATKIEIASQNEENKRIQINREEFLRALAPVLSDRSLIKRLFDAQLSSAEALQDAKHIIWDMRTSQEGTQYVYTSDYWLNAADIPTHTLVYEDYPA